MFAALVLLKDGRCGCGICAAYLRRRSVLTVPRPAPRAWRTRRQLPPGAQQRRGVDRLAFCAVKKEINASVTQAASITIADHSLRGRQRRRDGSQALSQWQRPWSLAVRGRACRWLPCAGGRSLYGEKEEGRRKAMGMGSSKLFIAMLSRSCPPLCSLTIHNGNRCPCRHYRHDARCCGCCGWKESIKERGTQGKKSSHFLLLSPLSSLLTLRPPLLVPITTTEHTAPPSVRQGRTHPASHLHRPTHTQSASCHLPPFSLSATTI